MNRSAGWVGVGLTLSGIAIQSFGPVRFSFVVFLVANALWFTHGLIRRDKPQMTVQSISALLNAHALLRFFGG